MNAPAARRPLALYAALLFLLCSAGYSGYRLLRTELSLTSEPAGASVFLNGRLVGATPLRVSGLSSGEYALRIEKSGYTPASKTLAVPAGGTRVHEQLAPVAVGTVRVNIKPDGAEVLLDGELIGHTPLALDRVPVGSHELIVRKTNYKAYMERIDVQPKDELNYGGFALEDRILTMLKTQIDTEPQRVSHYCDLGHYYFVNDRLEEAAGLYVRALETAASPLRFEEAAAHAERNLEMKLRADDVNRLNEELRRKKSWAGKDTRRFADVMARQQEAIAELNVKDWPWVREQADNFLRENKPERAERLYVRHIEASKASPTAQLASVALLRVRCQTKNAKGVQELADAYIKQYGSNAMWLREAGNAVYSNANLFDENVRQDVLGSAEFMLQKAVAATARRQDQLELHSLCKFELGNVFLLKKMPERSVVFYKDSIEGTADPETRDLRRVKLAEALKMQKRWSELREVLGIVMQSRRPDLKQRAEAELRMLEQAEPSPDQNKK